MVDKLYKFRPMLLIIIIPVLFSCASTQEEHVESRDAGFYNNRGIAKAEKGQYDQAILDYNKAIEIDPKYAEAYNNRGRVYRLKGQYDQAVLDYNKAIEIDPKYVDAYYNRATFYYVKREYDKAWDDIKMIQDLGYQVSPEFLEDLRKASGREK